jgi:uncharacterized protein YdeI (YjbR/CyaY-like superfamily)
MNASQEEFEPATRVEWRDWLNNHTCRPGGVWLVLHKGKGAPLSYEEAIDEAVAFGWIDSKAVRIDEQRYRIRISPRKSGSGWSRINKERVSRLTEGGLMAPAGIAAVESAKLDGSWEALNGFEALEIPQDLAAALNANPAAVRFFEAFPPSSKMIILGWIAGSKRAETRRQRIQETVRLAAQDIRAPRPQQASRQAR